MGELLLYGLYSAFGFHPEPFNEVRLVICVVNVVVLCVFAAKLARSREVGALTVMLVGFNAQLFSVYYESGMIYDALAFLFFYSGIALYCHYRRAGRMLNPVQGLQVVLLYIAALDSKEIAVSFPVALFLYELTAGEIFPIRGLLRKCRVAFVAALVTAIYIIGKNTGSDALSATAAYHPTISLPVYIHTYAYYAGEFILRSGSLPDALMAGTLAGSLALALLLKNRVLVWAALFNLFSVLPIAFIPPRNGFAFFVPLAGWGIYGAALLADLRQRLLRHAPVPRVAGQAGVVLALFFLILLPQERIMRRFRFPVMQLEQSANRQAWNSLQSVLPPNPGNKRILALRDPFENRYGLLFLTQLGFNNSGIVVDTPRTLIHGGRDASYADYDYVIDYDHGKFSRVAARDGKYDEPDPRIGFLGPWIETKEHPAAWSRTIACTNDGKPQPPVDLYGSTIGWQSKTVISGGDERTPAPPMPGSISMRWRCFDLTAPESPDESLPPRSPWRSWRNLLLAAFALLYGVCLVRLILPGLQSWFLAETICSISTMPGRGRWAS